MIIVNSFEGEGVEDVFNQAIEHVSWSPGISRDIKRILILYVIQQGLSSTRFFCTEMFKLSRDKAKFNSFVRELDSNRSLENNRFFIKEIFTKFVDDRAALMDDSLPLDPPRLKRSIQLKFLSDSKEEFVLCRNSKAAGYNITTEVTDLGQLSVDF